jgi:hypothetical protein
LRRLIAARHDIGPSERRTSASREWALFFELRNGTGYGRQDRYVDAFAFNLYPSKKHWRVAYEIKVSRADFLSELKKPEKRAFGFDISHEFWYACAPDVARPEEIPEGCGLLVAQGGKLVQKVVAQQRQPRELAMAEMAALARASCRYDILTSRMWLHQGCELDEDALNELVAERLDHDVREKIEQRVQAALAERLTEVQEGLATYAKALQEAGVTPPQWLLQDLAQGRLWVRDWEAHTWVRDNVSPGPNLEEVAHALQLLTDAQKRAQNTQERLIRELESLQQEQASALSAVKSIAKTPAQQPSEFESR